MKNFSKLLIWVILGYAIGVAVSYLVVDKPEDFVESLYSVVALLGLFAAFIAVLLISSSKTNSKDKLSKAGVGKTKSGEEMSQYFDAKWMTEKELRTNPKYMFNTYSTLPQVKKSGIVIRNQVNKAGKLEVNMYDPIHTLIIGTTGSGKTSYIISPAIRILSHTAEKPCLVITDVKGELYEMHSKQLRKEGYKILTLDLRYPFASTKWNPMSKAYDLYHKAKNLENMVKIHNGGRPSQFNLQETPDFVHGTTWYEYEGYAYTNREQLVNNIKAKKQELVDAAENSLKEIAITICPIRNQHDPSWEKGAQNLILGVMLAMLEDSDIPELGMTREKFNPYNLAKIVTTQDQDADNPYGTLRDYCSAGRSQFSKVGPLTSTAVNNAPGATKSYMGIVSDAVSIFNDMGICYATSQNDMHFEHFIDQPTVLFIKVPDEKESRHCIATMCISQLYQELIEIAGKHGLKLPKNVYFLLDEFANLPKIENMTGLITVSRSRGIFFELVVQSYSQLNFKYGNDVADTIKSNCNIHIFLGTEDQQTKEEFSKRCGEISLVMESTSQSKSDKKEQGTSTTTSTQVVTRPLIGPYELGQLDAGTCIVTILKNSPMKLKFTQAHKTPEFDQTRVGQEFVASKPFDEANIFYDIRERNKKMLKSSSSPFDF